MARPPGHGQAFEVRRQTIIDQAARLFAERGYAATGVSDLCNEVGLGKGALYYYIGSKENLLVEIQARVLGPLLEAAGQIRSIDAPPAVRLRLLSQQLVSGILNRLDHIWVYEHDYRYLTGDNRHRFRKQRQDFEDILHTLLEEADRVGEISVGDIELATLEFLNLHNHTYQWARESMKWSASDLSETYFRTLLLGFGADLRTVERAESAAMEFMPR